MSSPSLVTAAAPARIVVVDDEVEVAAVLDDLLKSLGHEITVAHNGTDAVRLLDEVRPEMVFTDINLPGMSGIEVLRCAQQLDPRPAVVVVTGNASTATAIEAVRHGAFDYIQKPFALDHVEQIVERGLANRRLEATNRALVAELSLKNEILERHEQELKERVAAATLQLKRLYDLGREVGRHLELAPRLSMICARSAELCLARAAVVYLTSEESGTCYAAAWHGADGIEADPSTLPAVQSDGVLGDTLIDHRVIRLALDPGVPSQEVPGLPGLSYRTLLAAPMIADGRVIGVLAVFDRDPGFTDDDRRFLEMFAAQTAVAVQNSQLYEHTKSLDRMKSEFVAVVSHEIRTPLTSIKGAIELLEDARFFPRTDQQQKLLNIAQANTERLLTLINDILDFSKLESSTLHLERARQKLEPVLAQAVHAVDTLLADKQLALDLRVEADLPEVVIDGDRISQVMTNLLSNAIKFSRPRGRIEVTAEHLDGCLRVSVRDHGEGIAPQDLGKLFRKFSQIDSSPTRRAGGAGLGLVICKGIVEQHGGHIGVDSTLGQGSVFSFTLPPANA
jgi:signal transduction histidine kinase/DNA-binding response OmpR family regulator